MRSSYDILNIRQNASKEDIKKAFRKLAKKHHPDRDKSPGANERFLEIHKAYKNLMGADYTAEVKASAGKYAWKPPTIVVTLRVSIYDLIENASKTFYLKKKVPCRKCNGTGSAVNRTKGCPFCNGTGLKGFFLALGTKKRCDYCDGAGIMPENPKCPSCGGTGLIFENTVETVHLNPFSDLILLSGKGNHAYGGTPGDLRVELDVENDTPFILRGMSVHTTVNVSAAQAILGETVKMSVFGKSFDLLIPPGTQDGEILKQPWSGLKHNGITGLFNARVRVITPRTVPANELQFYSHIRSSEKGRKWPKILTS